MSSAFNLFAQLLNLIGALTGSGGSCGFGADPNGCPANWPH